MPEEPSPPPLSRKTGEGETRGFGRARINSHQSSRSVDASSAERIRMHSKFSFVSMPPGYRQLVSGGMRVASVVGSTQYVLAVIHGARTLTTELLGDQV